MKMMAKIKVKNPIPHNAVPKGGTGVVILGSPLYDGPSTLICYVDCIARKVRPLGTLYGAGVENGTDFCRYRRSIFELYRFVESFDSHKEECGLAEYSLAFEMLVD